MLSLNRVQKPAKPVLARTPMQIQPILLRTRTRHQRNWNTELEKMYISYIRPLLNYSDSVWDSCSSDSKKQLESIHTEAARIITGAT